MDIYADEYLDRCTTYYTNVLNYEPDAAYDQALLDFDRGEDPCPAVTDNAGMTLSERAQAVSSYLPTGVQAQRATLAQVVAAEAAKLLATQTAGLTTTQREFYNRAFAIRSYLPANRRAVALLSLTEQEVSDAEAQRAAVLREARLIRAQTVSSYLPTGVTAATASEEQVVAAEAAAAAAAAAIAAAVPTPAGPYSLNWIRINTNETEPASRADTNTSISMLSVYTYKSTECNKIKECLKDPGTQRLPITFTDDGHVALDFLNNRARAFYHNPVIKPPLRTGSGGGRYATWQDVPNSEKPLGESISVERKVRAGVYGKVFFYGADFLFSENLKWILYKLPGYYYKKAAGSTSWDTAVLTQVSEPDVIPVYVLLYNPIHRRNFRELYKEMIKGTGSSTDPFRDTGNNFGYMATMKKYCNAFIVSSGRTGNNSRHTLRHYGDPSCAISLNRNNAKLSSIIKWNLTDDTIRTKYYNDRTVGGVTTSGYAAAISAVSVKLPSHIPYCPSIGGGNPSMFLKNASQLLGRAVVTQISGAPPPESTSFIQILANHVIAGSATFATAFTAAQINGGEGTNGNGGRAIQCPTQNITNVTCETNINIGDAGTMTNNDISASCGNEAAPEAIAQSERTLAAQCCPQQFARLYPNADITSITQEQLEAIQAAFNSDANAENRARIDLRARADAVLNYLDATRRITRIPPYTVAEVTAAEEQARLDPNNQIPSLQQGNQTPAQAPPAADGASDTLYIYFAIIVAILIAVIFGMYFILK